MNELINYNNIMNNAMRFFIKEVLNIVEKNGLPGNHHFLITFSTAHPEVRISGSLKERFPNEMTIVLQNWFDNLRVNEDGFSVTLNFNEILENLEIPYASLISFMDPSVEFGVKFLTNADQNKDTPEKDSKSFDLNRDNSRKKDLNRAEIENIDEIDKPKKNAKIVSLDNFRKS